MAQGLPKDETHNWDEDELLELIVAQFGDRKAEPSVHRVLPDECNSVTEVEPLDGDTARRELVIAER